MYVVRLADQGLAVSSIRVALAAIRTAHLLADDRVTCERCLGLPLNLQTRFPFPSPLRTQRTPVRPHPAPCPRTGPTHASIASRVLPLGAMGGSE
jgi:hypothetical protein